MCWIQSSGAYKDLLCFLQGWFPVSVEGGRRPRDATREPGPLQEVRGLGDQGGRVDQANARSGVRNNASREVKVVSSGPANHHGRIRDAGIVVTLGDDLQVSPVAVSDVGVLFRAHRDGDDAILAVDACAVRCDAAVAL